jgi:HK97 family phage portal protein
VSFLSRIFSRSSDGSGAAGAQPAAGAPTPPPPAQLGTMAPFGNQWPYYGSRYFQENLPIVIACVQAIAGGIASLPASVYRRLPDGKRVELPDHPVARLIRAPNRLQTWADFIEWLIASALLQGNAIAVVDHDGAGRPCGLYPVPWWCVQALLIPVSAAEAIGSPIVPNSRLVFDVTQVLQPWPLPVARPATGFPVRFFDDEVVFLRDRSDDGILGRSRLSRCPDAIQAAIGAQSFSSGVWTNGAVINGTLTHPGRLGEQAAANLAQSWQTAHSGGPNAGKVVILEEAMKYERMGISPEDAELLSSRQFSVSEVARLYQTPPPIVGDWSNSSFTNSATASQWHGSLCLLPWVNKIEREFSRTVINDPDVSLVIDLSGMLRGDYATMMSTNIAAVRAGIMSADEARVEAGLDPRGGDADRLVMASVGGRPDGVGDNEGDALPAPGGALNGAGKANGAAQP